MSSNSETLTPLAPPRGRGFRVQSLWCTGPPCYAFWGGKRASRPLNSHYLVVRFNISSIISIQYKHPFSQYFNISYQYYQPFIKLQATPFPGRAPAICDWGVPGGGGGGGGAKIAWTWTHAPCMYTSHVLKCQRNSKNEPKYLLR